MRPVYWEQIYTIIAIIVGLLAVGIGYATYKNITQHAYMQGYYQAKSDDAQEIKDVIQQASKGTIFFSH